MAKNTIFVLGNPVEPQDIHAIKLLPTLQKKFPHINFVRFDPTENFPQNKELIIIDTVIGINKVTKFENPTQWRLSPRNSVHDYDLPLELSILKKLGKIKNATIIGIPVKGNQKEILKEAAAIIAASGI